MESLSGTDWDVLILGTGLKQSLLALSLSRSDLRVLHTDKNAYYGGAEAALSLQDALAWSENLTSAGDRSRTTFSDAFITVAEDTENGRKLGFSRAYSLALAPQVLYSRSALLPLLVSSGVHQQLEFLAVGSWWIYEAASSSAEGQDNARLTKVPSSREDIFSDARMNVRTKRALVKFLRFVVDYDSQENLPVWREHASTPFPEFLKGQFNIPVSLQLPLLSLTLSWKTAYHVTTEEALKAVSRHLISMNVFGSGFAAVLPKWGGLSEIGQVGCRAMAVGGGVYVLNKSIGSIQKDEREGSVKEVQPGDSLPEEKWNVELDDGERLTAHWVVGDDEEFPSSTAETLSMSVGVSDAVETTARSISIVSSSLASLFPPAGEDAPNPAGAIVFFPSGSLERLDDPPVYLSIHSSDTGECPAGQCVIYASLTISKIRSTSVQDAYQLLNKAVASLLATVFESQSSPKPRVLWSMQYTQRSSKGTFLSAAEGLGKFSPLSTDVALDDKIVSEVKQVWKVLIGDQAQEDEFLKFPKRSGEEDEDD